MAPKNQKSDTEISKLLIEVALKHVVFDGWSNDLLDRIVSDTGVGMVKVLEIFPRGSIDIAIAFHSRDDDRFSEMFLKSDYNDASLRIRDRIYEAIKMRLKVAQVNREAVKRSLALFSNPAYLSDGSRAIWITSDTIWNLLGDQSDDLNWYSKRFILCSVLVSTLIIWIDDDSFQQKETHEFILRRINDVMSFERYKGHLKTVPIIGDIFKSLEKIPKHSGNWRQDFPGWNLKFNKHT